MINNTALHYEMWVLKIRVLTLVEVLYERSRLSNSRISIILKKN